MSKEFIAGLIAGEGCFSVALRAHDDCACGISASPKLTIGMHDRDLSLLESVQSELGIGDIYPNGDDLTVFAVNRSSDVMDLIDYLDAVNADCWISSDKYSTYQDWREFVLQYSPPQNRQEVEETVQFAKRLNHGDRGRSKEDWLDKATV